MKFSGTIFVEGKADLKFILDFVLRRFNYNLKRGIEILETEGKDALHKYVPEFLKSSDQGLTNLVVFDANGSHGTRLKEVTHQKENLGIQFETFLIPNNKDSGNLESLLRKAVIQENLFGCIDTYSACISSLNINELRVIDEKAKMYIYVDSFQNSGSSKDDIRNYLLDYMWNLDSEILLPFFEFLLPYFTQDAN